MLSAHFSDGAEVYVTVPYYFDVDVFLLVVYGTSAYYAVQLLHEEVPVSTFEHAVTGVFKLLGQRFDRFLCEGKFVVGKAEVEVFNVVEEEF